MGVLRWIIRNFINYPDRRDSTLPNWLNFISNGRAWKVYSNGCQEMDGRKPEGSASDNGRRVGCRDCCDGGRGAAVYISGLGFAGHSVINFD